MRVVLFCKFAAKIVFLSKLMAMEEKTLTIKDNKSSSAAVRKTYSVEELAEMFTTSPEVFMGIDLEEATLNWNMNRIYNLLYLIKNPESIDWLIDWMIVIWEENHHIYDSFDNARSIELREDCRKFSEHLRWVKSLVIERIKKEEGKNALQTKMLKGHIGGLSTTKTQHEIGTLEATQTKPPHFQPPQKDTPDDNKQRYHVLITDLPVNIQCRVLISQDVFDIFVEQLNRDTWTIVNADKTKYCDPLRFICNFHNITSRNTSRDEFNELLHYVVVDLNGKGSLYSSMSRCHNTSDKKIKRSYLCYSSADVNKKMRDEIWPLYDAAQTLEQSLQPVIEAMKQKENAASQTISQITQASTNL